MQLDPRYPVGRFDPKPTITSTERQSLIDDIAAAPAKMRAAVAGLSEAQLDTPYREGGWTVRQVVHHVPDSHLNAYTRLKLALTEETPTIRPYDEAAWAKLADVHDTPIETSLTLLDVLHQRWMTLWRSMSDADFARTLVHPEHKGTFDLDWLLQMYGWHSRHHVAHITTLRERSGW
jgi:hypothetical protein